MNDDEDGSDIRERLADYLTRVESYPLGPVNGKLTICAESMADALLPFIREELANRPPTQWAYDAACKALWKHRDRAAELRAALYTLVKLKDGPRDETYRALKEGAWQRAREVLAGGD